MLTLIDTTFSGKNIENAASVYEFTALADCTIRVQVCIAGIAGGANYVAYLTLNSGGTGKDTPMEPKTTAIIATGETGFCFATISLDVKTGDVVNIMVTGLTGDKNAAGSVRVFSDNYASAAELAAAHGGGQWGVGNGGSLSYTNQVIDSKTKLPVAGAIVELYPTQDYIGILDKQIVNDLGYFTFECLTAGTYYIAVIRAGYKTYKTTIEVTE